MEQLQLDLGSHLSMSIAGWSHHIDRQALYTAALLATVRNMLRGEGEAPYTPDWPWPAEPDADAVTDEEREAFKAKLKARSAFGQIRTEDYPHVRSRVRSGSDFPDVQGVPFPGHI